MEKRRPLRKAFRGDYGRRRPLTAFGVTPYSVILSEAKDLLLFMFSWVSLAGVMSNPLN